jgi:hypothetical protein
MQVRDPLFENKSNREAASVHYSIIAKIENVAKISNRTCAKTLRIAGDIPIKSFTKTSELKGESEKHSKIQ